MPEEIGAHALGHIAENRHIRAALHEAVARAPNLELIAPASVKSLAVEAGRATVTLANGEEIRRSAGDRRRRARLARCATRWASA